MGSLPFQSWSEPSLFSLRCDTEAYGQPSTMENPMPHIAGNEADRLSARKIAIPRLTEGAEAAFTSPGRFHRRHVRRACESCRQRKTKCTGDKSGCRNCREAGIICCYTDGKREKSKRQLASLSAKVQAYEDVIKKLSNRFGVSDEQLMSIALTVEAAPDLNLAESGATAPDRKMPWGTGTELPRSRSSSVGPFDVVDHTEEDFNRDETARATGFIGKSSEITWLQKLSREVEECDEWPYVFDVSGLPSPSATPRADTKGDPLVAWSNYYLDDMDLPAAVQMDIYEVPSRETATRLFNAYLTSVHPSYPIIGISTFVSQFQVFFNQPTLRPGSKWLAILNLIFAIGAKYIHLTNCEWKGREDDHHVYFSRAKALSLDDQLLHHPDLQQLQVEGLVSFYLLASGHINRSWKLAGSAVRGALTLGLHLRNVGVCTSDTSKEIRYRVWWSLYTIEHLVSVMTGRPSCIIDSACTTPLPVPFDEADFQKEEVARLISSGSRSNSSQLERMAVCSNTPSLNSSLDSDSNEPAPNPKEADMSRADYIKSLPPCMSMYSLQLTTLTSIAKRTTAKLYGPEAIQAPWASTEFTIKSLMLKLDSWFMNLPGAYDFTSTHTSQCPINQRVGLALLFYSTKISITRPCLCRLDGTHWHGDQAYDFCSKTAAECVESACHMLTLFPDTPDAALLYRASPWWCILHYLMQATTVLLLELAFKAQHVPEKKSTVSKAAKKAVEWLSTMSKSSLAAERAWKLCDSFLRRLAPKVDCDGGDDFPANMDTKNNSNIFIKPEAAGGGGTASASSASDNPHAHPGPGYDRTAATAAVTSDPLVDLDSVTCSPMDESSTPLAAAAAAAAPMPYGLEASEFLELMKPEKPVAPPLPSGLDEYLPYDPATGQITGSFFPSSSSIDLDMGCYWGDPDLLTTGPGGV